MNKGKITKADGAISLRVTEELVCMFIPLVMWTTNLVLACGN